MVSKIIVALAAVLCITAEYSQALAEDTYIFSVQLSASVSESPARIALSWMPDPYYPTNFLVYRKAKEATSWGDPIASLSGTALAYEDWSVGVGQAYEYQVVKASKFGWKGYGYIYAGIRAPDTPDRGKIVLVTAWESLQGLDSEVNTLRNDLAGDGWVVLQKTISSNDTPAYVRSVVRSEYLQDPNGVKAVFLLGHVPVLHSGNLNYDGHLLRPMPADAYYGEMDEDWPTDPSSSPSYMPSNIELMAGRVDFFNMPGLGASPPWPSETELLRKYLNKDHQWRHGILTAPRRALMGNRRGDEGGEATAASGYRNFQPIVGPGNIVEADISDGAYDSNRWLSVLGRESYLLAYGCAGGLPKGISWLGTHGPYKEAWSSDLLSVDAKAVFTMLFGSWFGNWDEEDNFMRSFLITSQGLAICMAGRPHWFIHHCALGEPLGYGTRLSMNNSTLYKNDINDETRAVYVALMGDPTLRIDVVRPPTSLAAARSGSTMNLSWAASPDATEGYRVFRAPGAGQAFASLTPALIQSLNYSDPNSPGGLYMVRAVKLENRFSGSYFNLSQGITVPAPPAQPSIVADRVPQGLRLTWNTTAGTAYRVETRSSLTSAWQPASSTLTASGTSLSWTNTSPTAPAAYFRVTSP